jgi:transcriptional regulator with PAS, ATPase and Fis domain
MHCINSKDFLLKMPVQGGNRMSRLSPRANKKVQASIVFPDKKERPVDLKNIGLGGVFLDIGQEVSAKWFAPKTIHILRISIGNPDELLLRARVVRNGGKGLALRFSAISQGDLLKIWEFICRFIADNDRCPYCNHRFKDFSENCPNCERNQDFKDKDYLTYWKKKTLLNRISDNLSNLELSELQKVSELLEKDSLIMGHSPPCSETEEFVGTCPAIKEVFALIRKIAPTDFPVVIFGESGTGKELTVMAIHGRSPRNKGPFVAINCAAIPESLLEAELFGHAKGAFTGAHEVKKGKFEQADGGTLLLDEIGEMPLNLQSKLLRFLETQIIEPIGSQENKKVNVRILAATNMDLEKAVATGSFRLDLYYRLKVFTINLPPLRERGADKAILAQYFLKKIKKEGNWPCKGFTPAAMAAINGHSWPGNVREMINRIRRAVVVQDEWVRPEDMELDAEPYNKSQPKLKEAKNNLKKELIQKTLTENGYNISQTARSLGISRQHLYLLKKKLAIKIPE